MRIQIRQAALCILRRDHTFLVAEVRDPHTGLIYHRPPGGGLEPNESPEQAVRREIQEELGITLMRFLVIRYGVIPASRGGKLKTLTQGVAGELCEVSGTSAAMTAVE